VDRLCAALFLTHTAKEGDDNLSLVRNRLLKSEADLASLLDLYGKLRAGKGVADDETNALCGVLKLSGVANVADGRLRVKNRIYERVFDRGWVAQHMPDAELRRQRAAYRRGLVRAAGVSAVVLAVIGALALAAIRSDARAKLLAEDRRKALYAAQMNLAYQAYRSDAVGRAVALLEAQRPQVGQQDLRGFDWRYLWQRCHGDDPAVLPPNPAGVFAVAYSPPADPRGGPTRTLLATGDGSGAVQLWDAAGPEGTARRLATLEGHEGAIDVLAFSPDGKRLATASGDDGKVKVWDLASRRGLFTRPGTRGMFARLAFSPDGKLLAIASEITKSVNVWAVAVRPGEPQPQTPLWSVPAWGPLAFSPDGKTLAIAAVAPFYDGFTVTWCDVEARQVLRRSPTQSENGSVAWCAAFSPDGKTLATGDDGKNLVILWDVATGQKRGVPLTGHTLLVWSLAFSPDSKTLASGSCDGTVKLWDVAAGKERSTLHGHTGQVRSVAFSPDGRRLASGSPDGSTRLWATRRPRTAQAVRDRRDLDEIPVRTVGREFVIAFAFSPEGQILAVATTHSVTFWNTATRKREKTRLEAQRDADCFFGLAFTPDGAAVATGSQGGTVRLWNRATGELIAELRRHRSFVFLLGFAAGGRLVTASGGEDPYLRVWDLASPGRSPAVTREIPGTVGVPHQAIAVSRDGKIVVMGSPDNRVRLWEVASGRPMGTLEGRISSLHSVAITPDGRIVAGAGLDGRVILWDRNTGRRIRALSGHRGAVLSMDFSPDGRTLATGSMDRTVKLWNPAIDQEVATFSGYGSWVWRVQFSPDGNTLASAGMQGPVWLRRAAPFVETDASQGGR
jgi:WD40 repeat protein